MTYFNGLSAAFLSLAFLFSMTAGVNANLVLNAGFENGTGTDASDWNEIVGGSLGAVERSGSMPNTGGFSAVMSYDHPSSGSSGGAYFIEQNQGANTIDSSLNYSFSFFAKSESTDFTGVNMFYEVQWLDQDGSDGGGFQGSNGGSLTSLGINTTYQQFGFTNVDVPDTADSFLIRFQASPGGVNGISNALFIDDVVLTQAVPEPSALGLFACAIGLMTSRRKR